MNATSTRTPGHVRLALDVFADNIENDAALTVLADYAAEYLPGINAYSDWDLRGPRHGTNVYGVDYTTGPEITLWNPDGYGVVIAADSTLDADGARYQHGCTEVVSHD